MERPWSYDNFLSHDRFRKYEIFPSSVVFGAQVSESCCDLNVADAQLNLLNLPSDLLWLSFGLVV